MQDVYLGKLHAEGVTKDQLIEAMGKIAFVGRIRA